MEEQFKALIKEAVKEVLEEMKSYQPQSESDGFPEIMSLDQASKFVHLTKDYIKNFKDDLGIPHRRKGRTYLFVKSELVEWVKGREEEKPSKIKISSVRTKGSIMKIV